MENNGLRIPRVRQCSMLGMFGITMTFFLFDSSCHRNQDLFWGRFSLPRFDTHWKGFRSFSFHIHSVWAFTFLETTVWWRNTFQLLKMQAPCGNTSKLTSLLCLGFPVPISTILTVKLDSMARVRYFFTSSATSLIPTPHPPPWP